MAVIIATPVNAETANQIADARASILTAYKDSASMGSTSNTSSIPAGSGMKGAARFSEGLPDSIIYQHGRAFIFYAYINTALEKGSVTAYFVVEPSSVLGNTNGNHVVNSTDSLIVFSYDTGMTIPFLLGQAGMYPAEVTLCPGCSP